MASETFKLLTVANSIVGLGGFGTGDTVVAIGVDLGKNWEIEEFGELAAGSTGFPLLAREVEEEGNLKEKGENVIFHYFTTPLQVNNLSALCIMYHDQCQCLFMKNNVKDEG